MSLRKVESEKQSKDHAIRTLQDEMQQQDSSITKLMKERKNHEEIMRKLTEDLHAEEDKTNHATKTKQKLEATLADLDQQLEREKANRQVCGIRSKGEPSKSHRRTRRSRSAS